MRAHGNQYRVKTLASKFGDGEVASGRLIQFELMSPVARISRTCASTTSRGRRYSGMPRIEHATRNLCGFKYCYCIPHQCEVVCGREPDRATSNNSYFVRKFLLRATGIYIYRTTRLWPMTFG